MAAHTPKLLTIRQALEYLRTTRGMTVSRQTLSLFIQQHQDRCTKIEGPHKKKAALWLLPQSLLAKFTISARHQESGRAPKQ